MFLSLLTHQPFKRCDGEKPFCYKCRNQQDSCVYDDGPALTKTQRTEAENLHLKQRVYFLEQRLQESEFGSPSRYPRSLSTNDSRLSGSSSSYASLSSLALSVSSLPLAPGKWTLPVEIIDVF
jgi:hypothetical protein